MENYIRSEQENKGTNAIRGWGYCKRMAQSKQRQEELNKQLREMIESLKRKIK